MKVNNTEKTGAKVGWERRRGWSEVSEREERKGGRQAKSSHHYYQDSQAAPPVME